MKLHFYIVTLLLAGNSIYAMQGETITSEPSSPPTSIPQNPPPALEFEAYNLNTLADPNWNPGESLSAKQLAQRRNALYEAIKNPNLGKFQDAYQYFPAEFRNSTVISICGHTCHTIANDLTKEIKGINQEINSGKKHDYRTIGKYSLIETGYIGASLLLAATAKVMTNSIDKMFRSYISLPGAIGSKSAAKLSIIIVASSAIIGLLPVQFVAMKNAYKAWYYQDTLQQRKNNATKSFNEVSGILKFIDETRHDWIPGSYIDTKSYNAKLVPPQKDSKQEEDKK